MHVGLLHVWAECEHCRTGDTAMTDRDIFRLSAFVPQWRWSHRGRRGISGDGHQQLLPSQHGPGNVDSGATTQLEPRLPDLEAWRPVADGTAFFTGLFGDRGRDMPGKPLHACLILLVG